MEEEAIFNNCTAFEVAAQVIDEVEEHTGKPVDTANHAAF